jgi:hypothetical protein
METAAEQPVVFGSQQFIDRVNLLCHCEIAKRLAREPERVLGVARETLARCLEEWEELIETRAAAQIILNNVLT